MQFLLNILSLLKNNYVYNISENSIVKYFYWNSLKQCYELAGEGYSSLEFDYQSS